MKIGIGTDHAGFEIKNELAIFLQKEGYDVVDCGTFNKDSSDYTDYAEKVSRGVAIGEYDRGILVCMTGVGMSIAANKVHGIRAALVRDIKTAELTRQHNDSNVLVVAGLFSSREEVHNIAKIWLSTDFSGEERHVRRIQKITKLEQDS